MTRRRSAILAVVLFLGVGLGGCGDDPAPIDDNAVDASQEEERPDFTVALAVDAIEMPGEVTGGVVRVELESDLEEAEVNFTQVASGTAEDQFKQGISGVVAGGPIPQFVRETTGILSGAGGGSTAATLILPEGEYIAWSIPEGPPAEEPVPEEAAAEDPPAGDPAAEESGGPGASGPPPEAIVTKTFTVSPGEPADLPELDGNEIVARDYSFEVSVTAGADEFVFRNEGPDQLHHVVLFNFGDVAPDLVEENLVAFLEGGEDAPPPPALKDVDLENLGAGDGPVLTPGLGATTTATAFESGSTYAAVCFIGDRSGGPPHAFAHGMRTVFTVE